MGSYSRRSVKNDLSDKTPFTRHMIDDETCINRDWWSNLTEMTFVSIDPGIINFGIRIEKRPVGVNVWNVQPLHYENKNFEECKKNPETHISPLYRSISEYLNSLSSTIKKAHIIIIESQMVVNINMIRCSQHIITHMLDTLSESELCPMILEINSTTKTIYLGAPKNLNRKQVKDWSIEKALQLSYIRKDWVSFFAILDAARNKSDDLSDVIIQIEVICLLFNYGITPIPTGWDQVPAMAGWSPGQIFFQHLLALLLSISTPVKSQDKLEGTPSVNAWLIFFRKNRDLIISSREKMSMDGLYQENINSNHKSNQTGIELVVPTSNGVPSPNQLELIIE